MGGSHGAIGGRGCNDVGRGCGCLYMEDGASTDPGLREEHDPDGRMATSDQGYVLILKIR